MAFLLQSLRLARNFTTILRHDVLAVPRFSQNHVLGLPSIRCVSQFPNETGNRSERRSPRENFKMTLRYVQNLLRSGRPIQKLTAENLQAQFRLQRNVTSHSAWTILMCCSRLCNFEDMPTRAQYTLRVWQRLQELNVPLDTSLYNAVLMAFLANEVPFSTDDFLADMEKKGIQPSKLTFEKLIASHCERGDIVGATKLMEKMTERKLPVQTPVFNALIVGFAINGEIKQGEGIIEKITNMGLEPSAETYHSLLRAFAIVGDGEGIQRTISECKEKNILLVDVYYLNAIFALAVNGHADQVDAIIEQLPQANPSVAHIVDMILRLCNRHQAETAYKLLKAIPSVERTDDESSQYSPTAGCKILNTLADEGKVEEVNRVFEELSQDGVTPTINYRMISPLVKVHLTNGDLTKAVEIFEEIVTKYQITPCRNELTMRLIEAQDPVGLQRVSELCSEVHGQENSLFDLAFAFLETNFIRQARKIFEAPGIWTRAGRFWALCNHAVNHNNPKLIQNALEATSTSTNVNQMRIFEKLLTIYENQGAPKEAAELYEQAQEMGLSPSYEFLSRLASLLRKHDIEVTFTLPERPPQERVAQLPSYEPPVSPSSVSECSQYIRRLAVDAEFDKAVEFILKMFAKDVKPDEKSGKGLVLGLSKAGDLKNLQLLGDVMDIETKKAISFDNYVCNAYCTTGRAEEYLQQLEADIGAAESEPEVKKLAQRFPSGGAYGILETFPELLEKYEQVAVKYSQKKVFTPLWVLWQYLFILGDEAAATKLYDAHLSGRNIQFKHIVRKAERNNDVVLFERLIPPLRLANCSKEALGVVYSHFIRYHLKESPLKKSNVDAAHEVLTQAVTDVGVESIGPGTLASLKRAMEEQGKTFPYDVPPKRRAD